MLLWRTSGRTYVGTKDDLGVRHNRFAAIKIFESFNCACAKALVPEVVTHNDQIANLQNLWHDKEGTAIIDSRNAKYSCATKSNRWTLSVLCYILDIILVKCQTIYSFNNSIDPRQGESWTFVCLGVDLTACHSSNWAPCSFSSRNSNDHPGENVRHTAKAPSARGWSFCDRRVSRASNSSVNRTCKNCYESISSENAAKRKRSLTKLQSQCQKCVCSNHSVLCSSCVSQNVIWYCKWNRMMTNELTWGLCPKLE